jgi:hypothetical protein
LNASAVLRSVEVKLPLKEVYSGIEFPLSETIIEERR